MKPEYIKFDPNSNKPLYVQLSRSIRDAIRSNLISAGDKLPTEDELVHDFELSRPVVRQAYRRLIEEGLIYRHKGRGTFVRHTEFNYDILQSLLPITRKIRMVGMEPDIINHGIEVIPYDASWMQCLNLEPGDQLVKVKRLYYADGKPLLLTEMHFPLRLFPGLDKLIDGRSSVFDVILNHYPIRTSKAHRTIAAVILSDDVCTSFNLPSGSAGFKIESVTYTDTGIPMELTVSYLTGIGAKVSINFFDNL